MSTNDTVLLLASGASGVVAGPGELRRGGHRGLPDLAQQLLADAEGATKDDRDRGGGRGQRGGRGRGGRAVARNNLVKSALFGEDPNWGRILAAVGTTGAQFEPDELDVAVNGVWVCRDGCAGEDRSKVDLSGRDVTHHRRPRRRRRRRDHLDQRPVRRVRARELGLLDMTAHCRRPRGQRDPAIALAKAGTLIEALPWLSRFHGRTVVRQVRRATR